MSKNCRPGNVGLQGQARHYGITANQGPHRVGRSARMHSSTACSSQTLAPSAPPGEESASPGGLSSGRRRSAQVNVARECSMRPEAGIHPRKGPPNLPLVCLFVFFFRHKLPRRPRRGCRRRPPGAAPRCGGAPRRPRAAPRSAPPRRLWWGGDFSQDLGVNSGVEACLVFMVFNIVQRNL